MTMENENPLKNIIKTFPSLIGILSFISGNAAINLLSFLLNLSDLFKKSPPIQPEPALHIPNRIPKPKTTKKQPQKAKPKRRQRTYYPSIIQIRSPRRRS